MFKNAACLGETTKWWFPERTGKSHSEMREIFFNTKRAVDICKTCPCLKDCLEYSINNYEIGIWGGMGEKLRKRARRMQSNGMPISEIIRRILGIKVA
jgi:hypothetical protein